MYDLYIEESSIYILKENKWSINSIEIKFRESETLSLDIFELVKIWNSNTLTTFQTINLNEIDEDISNKVSPGSLLKNKLTFNIKHIKNIKITIKKLL